MLTEIDIKNFGSFHNFMWQSCVDSGDEKALTFKDLNIIYGRNYSGKTTLSRLVGALDSGTLPTNYTNPEFTITRTDGSSYARHNLSDYPDEVRVFNRDYINDYLGFLIDESRDIKPFAVLGKENAEITEKIKKLQDVLDGADGTGGLNTEKEKLQGKLNARAREHDAQIRSLEKLYTDKARSIKYDTLLNVVTYNARPLKDDLKVVAREELTPLAVEGELELRNTFL